MNTMHVYYVTQKGGGMKTIELYPRVPETVGDDEDQSIKRICVSPSIIGAMVSCAKNLFGYCSTYVYHTEIPVDKLIQPNREQVPDVHVTGELWVLEPLEMNLVETLILRDADVYWDKSQMRIQIDSVSKC